MEVSWLYALLNAANKSVADRLSIPLLLVILLVSFGISKALKLLYWPKSALTSLSWLVWIIVMLLMIKVQLFPGTDFGDAVWLSSIPHAFSQIFTSFEPALLILLSSAVLWWFGRRLAYSKADFPATLTEFQFGLVVLIIVFFTAYELHLDQSSSLPISMVFFSLALIGISLAHFQENDGWFNSLRQTPWPVMLLVSIGIIILFGLLISAIVTPDFIKLILKGLAWVWSMIDRFLVYLASIIPNPFKNLSLPPTPPSTPLPDERGGIGFPEWLIPAIRLGLGIIIGGMFLIAIWISTSQILDRIRRRARKTGGEVESLKGAFKLDLINWLKRVLSRIFGIKFGPSARNKAVNISPETASVRLLYRQFLHWAVERGYPRHTSQTPFEFQHVLSDVVMDNQDALDFITREYMNARYGFGSTTEDELSQLKQKWQALRKTDLKKPEDKIT